MAGKHKPYEQFGPYILFKKLETDSLGDLWRAARIEDDALGSIVAIRRLTGGNRDAIVSSISIARQVAPLLTGPSFARNQVIDVVSGVPFVAHDYAGGRSLRHIIDRARGGAGVPPNPIPIDQALVIAERVALSLATIAELRFAGEKLSHGALLPQFVWISDDGEIRVAGQQLGKGLVSSGGDLARYFSPEYQHSHEVTKASEVYSLGAILFVVVTGHEPQDATSTSAFAASIRAAKTMNGTPIPDDIRHIIEKSLNLDPSARFASVADMKAALSALTSGGKYSATSFNLAFYLSTLLKKEFEAEALEREKESKVSVAPYIDAVAAPEAVEEAPLFGASAASKEQKSKAPLAIAAIISVAIVGAGTYLALGSKKQSVRASTTTMKPGGAPPAPVPAAKQPLIGETIVSTPSTHTARGGGAATPTTATLDPAAQKKAFEDAVKQKLHDEMMKLQAQYTKQLQQQQSKNAPVPAAPAAAPTSAVAEEPAPRTTEERSSEPSAAQLDLQRQRENQRTETVTQQAVAPVTQAPPPVVQQPQTAAPATTQIHEGDVVDITQVDVLPKRTRDPYVIYPPMAAKNKIETNVITSVLISENGDVLDVKVLRGDDRFGFTDAAVRAVRTAHYTPAMKDGKRVRTWLPQMISFKP